MFCCCCCCCCCFVIVVEAVVVWGLFVSLLFLIYVIVVFVLNGWYGSVSLTIEKVCFVFIFADETTTKPIDHPDQWEKTTLYVIGWCMFVCFIFALVVVFILWRKCPRRS